MPESESSGFRRMCKEGTGNGKGPAVASKPSGSFMIADVLMHGEPL